jgi:molybdopterin/thiamine biosynthesis adenylyltransferase
MKIRITEALWASLSTQLFARTDVENAGILIGNVIKSDDAPVVVITEGHIFQDQDFLIRQHDQISINPVSLNKFLRPAREKGQSVFTIHTHPGADEAWFSRADDVGDSRLMPSIMRQIPDAPHGSMVLIGNGTVAARTFTPDGRFQRVTMASIGRGVQVITGTTPVTHEWSNRQELALGQSGQGKLARAKVGIVGLGGIGAMASMMLSHLGIGELALFDGDKIEASNVTRIPGATLNDIGRLKVDVAARYAGGLGFVKKIERYADYIGEKHHAALSNCDVIISAVDRQTPRAMLNRLSYRDLVPVIDLGTAFRVNDTGKVTGDAGRVVVVGPERPCLACWGHLDPRMLAIEALSDEEREQQMKEGYIEGAFVPQPSVISFNGSVAAAGVSEVLRLLTAFAGAETPPLRLAFSFTEGTVRRNSLAGDRRCKICGQPHDGAA